MPGRHPLTPRASKARQAPAEYDIFAVTAHGLELLCAAELSAIGVSAKTETGGAAWRGDLRSLYRANLELRTASRVIARVGEFRARGFPELERHVARLPWADFIRPGASAVLRVTCRKSRLYHEGAVAERVTRVLTAVAGVTVEDRRATDDDDVGDGAQPARNTQLIIVRFLRDVCTISVDASGSLLHQRGYRQALAKAPLRETIAAALLLASGWRGDTPLLDPLCGSGTIPIEAALLAGNVAPGLAGADRRPRSYGFESWPGFDPALWRDTVASAHARIREVTVPIIGSDRDAGAIAAATANAARAGVSNATQFRRATLGAVEPAPDPGHIVTNPPYGVRVGDRRDLHGLYAALGSRVRDLPGWSLTMLTADDGLAAATGLPLREILATRNGGIPVRLLTTASD